MGLLESPVHMPANLVTCSPISISGIILCMCLHHHPKPLAQALKSRTSGGNDMGVQKILFGQHSLNFIISLPKYIATLGLEEKLISS